MSRLTWDNTGERTYELGVKRCVLFVMNNDGTYKKGVAWSGVTSITENRSGAEEVSCWADGIKYASLRTTEEFGATIEAYQCPPEFYECDGTLEITNGIFATQQKRKSFGLCYTTSMGNDIKGTSYGEKIHIIYGATASVSERDYLTINDSPETVNLSWEITTEPIEFDENLRPSAHFIVDATNVWHVLLRNLKNALYGTDTTESRLPEIDEIVKYLTDPVLCDASGNYVADSHGNLIRMH